jgi:ubiquinone/menaquinone biosynthesis C-methylase UbiE
MIKTCKDFYSDPGSGADYEAIEYASSTYSTILWEIEKVLLLQELEKIKSRKTSIDYLDFACGTGRIMGFVQPHVDAATGLDTSQPMLEIAREKLQGKGVELICRDITADRPPPERKYDLITCFRFLRNSEQHVRVAALAALSTRLRDGDSRLVINNHGNLCSYHFFRSSLQTILKPIRNMRPLNYLSHRSIVRMMRQAGLEIVDVHGYSYLSFKSLLVCSPKFVKATESFLADKPLLRKLGGVQMYVARLR